MMTFTYKNLQTSNLIKINIEKKNRIKTHAGGSTSKVIAYI